jgi:hypothetical protein
MENTKRVKERKWRLPRREACPLCGCKELLTEGPDQFCSSCHWDTCAEYVERGLMNNMSMAYAEHFVWDRPAKAPVSPEHELASVFVEDDAVGALIAPECERVG